MKVAITNPTDWPQVRRGAERFINELADYLTRQGHEVTIISAHPGRTKRISDRGYRTIHYRRLWHPSFQKIGLLEFHAFFVTTLQALLRERFDIVHCCTFMDAYAADWARQFTGVPYVFLINGIPPRAKYYRSLTLKGAIFRRAVLHADEVVSISRYMHEYFEERFGRGGMILPIPVDTDRFAVTKNRDHERPIILCAASLDDARKGGSLLARAFDRLKEIVPGVRLKLVGSASKETRDRLLSLIREEWQKDVEFLDPSFGEQLPQLYGEAAITVLPSLWEAFGMVIIESLATGTPVVGTRDGAISELIDNPAIGRLFDPGEVQGAEATNIDGLVEAMREALELSRNPLTAERCREHARLFSWSHIGPQFEGIYRRLVCSKESNAEAKRPVKP